MSGRSDVAEDSRGADSPTSENAGSMSDEQFQETLDALLDIDTGSPIQDPPGPISSSAEPTIITNSRQQGTANLQTTDSWARQRVQQPAAMPPQQILPQLASKPIALAGYLAGMAAQQGTTPGPSVGLYMPTLASAQCGAVASATKPAEAGFTAPGPSSRTNAPLPPSSSMRTTMPSTSTQTKKRAASQISAISEDESDRSKRQDRNMREQQRSQQLTNQIRLLRDVLVSAKIQFKTDKYSTLVTVVEYIKQLQERAHLLDAEHQKLLQTIIKSTELVNNQYVPVASTNEQFDLLADVSSPAPEDDSEVFVNGIDYKSIFGCCPFACSVASIDGRFIDCNKEFEEMCGYTREELLRSPEADSVAAKSSPGSAVPDACNSNHKLAVSPRSMSLFNVVRRDDMGRAFAAMSDMLKCHDVNQRPTEGLPEGDTRIETVEFCRKAGVEVCLWSYCCVDESGL